MFSALSPDGSIFSLFIVFIIVYLFGELLSLINFPLLLGMLISGSLIGNIFKLNVNPQNSYVLRNFALTIILIRAGLGLNPRILKKWSFVCLRLEFIPCTFEATAICNLLFMKFLIDLKFTVDWLLILSGIFTIFASFQLNFSGSVPLGVWLYHL